MCLRVRVCLRVHPDARERAYWLGLLASSLRDSQSARDFPRQHSDVMPCRASLVRPSTSLQDVGCIHACSTSNPTRYSQIQLGLHWYLSKGLRGQSAHTIRQPEVAQLPSYSAAKFPAERLLGLSCAGKGFRRLLLAVHALGSDSLVAPHERQYRIGSRALRRMV